MQFISNFLIGEAVIFVSPNNHKEWNIKAIVTAVKFTGKGKVRYDLDLIFDEGRYATRIHSVDSACVFMLPIS